MHNGNTFTLRDLFVAITFISLFLALASLGIQHARTPARRGKCGNNLHAIGIALQAYHDQFKTFPPGGVRRGGDPTKTFIGVHALLLPFFGEWNNGYPLPYDPAKDWLHQNPDDAAIAIPWFVCPSSSGGDPFKDPLLNQLVLMPASGTAYTKDQEFGSTTYVFCKGVTDAWCRGPNGGPPGPPSVPVTERGMFDMNWGMAIRAVTDGTSRTIAAGEGAVGPAWRLTATTKNQPDRWTPAPPYNANTPWPSWPVAHQAWIGMEPSNATLSAQGLYVSSPLACTLEPMNKNPVTDSWADITALDDCRKSLPSAPGATGPTTCDGPHVTPNFRSDHPGGVNFLFADGSVRFIAEEIDMLLYQRLSTPLDAAKVDVP